MHVDESSIRKPELETQLSDSLKHWKKEGMRAVWLKLSHKNLSEMDMVIKKFKFEMHHCTKEHIMLSKWLIGKEESRLPCFSTHNLGAAGLVFN